ncbi:hypothetical protein [Rhodococcus sp. NPDC060176]|uniref:hypothetical protein n=1 Tax=Rhodococcus sp. NPDC060176 TaxID=3347062 RepID=UPI00364DDB18
MGTSDRNVIAHGIAMGLEDAGWSKPRTVNSATELKAEPDGTILRDEDGMVGVVSSDGSGFRYVLAVGDPRPYTFASWAVSPSAVLFTPGDAG